MRHVAVFVAVALALALADAHAQTTGDVARGRAYAERICSECHAVRPDQALSPKFGVAPFKVIADTPGMTAMALSVWLRSTHRDMPNLIIPADDRDDVIAYIESLKAKR